MWRLTSFQLGKHYPSIRGQAQHIESIRIPFPASAGPTRELTRDDQDVWPDDLRLGDDPLLKVLTLSESGLRQVD